MKILNKYIKFHKGSIPLLISVPHGGTIKYNKISTRKEGVLGTDKGTIELAYELIKRLERLFRSKNSSQKTPSYIISKVHRSKIDLNRKESEAYDDNSILARNIYQYYHKKIKELIEYNIISFNHSLLIDIHGFEKNKKPQGFRDVEIVLGTNNLETIFSSTIPKKDWQKNLRGRIIRKFIELNIPIAPGHQRRREYILTGGFIINNYGASKIVNSQAIQIEFSDKVRIFDESFRNKVVLALAELLVDEFV
jgi:N-formylglutamate amidohydrolase